MFIPYFNATPVAPVFFILYDPAKSTKKNLAVMNPSSYLCMFCCSKKMVKMAWDLEDVSFIIVAAVVLLILPRSNKESIWAESSTLS